MLKFLKRKEDGGEDDKFREVMEDRGLFHCKISIPNEIISEFRIKIYLHFRKDEINLYLQKLNCRSTCYLAFKYIKTTFLKISPLKKWRDFQKYCLQANVQQIDIFSYLSL